MYVYVCVTVFISVSATDLNIYMTLIINQILYWNVNVIIIIIIIIIITE
jgi:hypothetical protein